MERRTFVKTACALCGVAAAVTFIDSCKKENVNFTIDLTDPGNAALTHDGGYLYFDRVIVARVNSSTYIALSKTCTHSGCTVVYVSANGDIECPCHGGKYSTAGVVTAGPPPKNLKTYTVVQNGTLLTVS